MCWEGWKGQVGVFLRCVGDLGGGLFDAFR